MNWRFGVRLGTLAAVALAGLVAHSAVASLSERYQYKMPCPAGVDCHVTTLAHSADALDFDIGGGGTSGPVRSVSEGEVIRARWDVLECDVTDDYLGKYVQVQDIFGRTLTYAHLSQFDPELYEGKWVLQGDKLGTEGDTGKTYRWDGEQWVPCGVHLHLTNVASLAYIDNQEVDHLGIYTSTNSVIGETAAGYRGPEGQAIRDEYFAAGVRGGNFSWNVVGWTRDIEGLGTAGLWMRRDGSGAAWEQTFEHDAAPACSGRSGIYVSDNRPADAYWVDNCLWDRWIAPASNFPEASGRSATGYARTLASASYCPWELGGCTSFQAFYHGYVWSTWWGQVESVAAPDVDGNEIVDFVGDVIIVASSALIPGPYQPGCDVNASGGVDFVEDAIQMAKIALLGPQEWGYQSRVPGGLICPRRLPS